MSVPLCLPKSKYPFPHSELSSFQLPKTLWVLASITASPLPPYHKSLSSTSPQHTSELWSWHADALPYSSPREKCVPCPTGYISTSAANLAKQLDPKCIVSLPLKNVQNLENVSSAKNFAVRHHLSQEVNLLPNANNWITSHRQAAAPPIQPWVCIIHIRGWAKPKGTRIIQLHLAHNLEATPKTSQMANRWHLSPTMLLFCWLYGLLEKQNPSL